MAIRHTPIFRITIDTILQKLAYPCATRYADFIRFSGKPHLNAWLNFEPLAPCLIKLLCFETVCIPLKYYVVQDGSKYKQYNYDTPHVKAHKNTWTFEPEFVKMVPRSNVHERAMPLACYLYRVSMQKCLEFWGKKYGKSKKMVSFY